MSNTLIKVCRSKKGELPFSNSTIGKYYKEGRYPNIIYKVCGILYFDMDEFMKEAEKNKRDNIKKSIINKPKEKKTP